MQSLASNMEKIEYALYLGVQDILVDGKRTGDKAETYAPPKEFWIYVSPSKGEAVDEPFGINEEYTNVMSTCDMSCPIAEDTILWIRKSSANGAKHNYVVKAVARGLNSIKYAIKKVSIS